MGAPREVMAARSAEGSTPFMDAGLDGPRVSIVVPTRHRRDQALALVDSVQDDPAVLEIIVVVDGGTDDTYSRLKSVAKNEPKVRPIWQPHAGAGAARQNGLDHASGEIVLFLDDDVMPEPGLASGHLGVHQQTPGGVVVGSLPSQRPRRRTVHSLIEHLYADDYDTCCSEYTQDPSTVLSHLWSGNLSLGRHQALTVGVGDSAFDTLFFEDRDLGLRLRAAGVTAVFRPDLRAAHHHVGTLSGFLRDSVRQGKALFLLHRRYPGEATQPTARHIAGRFPAPARWLLEAALLNPAGVGRVLTNLMFTLSYCAGLLHLWAIQRVLIVFMRRAGQATGVGLARRAQHEADNPLS